MPRMSIPEVLLSYRRLAKFSSQCEQQRCEMCVPSEGIYLLFGTIIDVTRSIILCPHRGQSWLSISIISISLKQYPMAILVPLPEPAHAFAHRDHGWTKVGLSGQAFSHRLW